MDRKNTHESVIDNRETRKLSVPKKPLHQAIASIELFKGDDLKHKGTGFVVEMEGFRFILTSAHLFFIREKTGNELIEDIQISCGRNGDRLPFSVILKRIHDCRYPDKYCHKEPDEYDFGVILLGDEDKRFLPDFSFHLESFNDSPLGTQLSLSGYPDEMELDIKPEGSENLEKQLVPLSHQCFTRVKPVPHLDNIIKYKEATSCGMSGSPIYYNDKDKSIFVAVGIHCTGDEEMGWNFAVSLTDKVQQEIKALLQSSEQPSEDIGKAENPEDEEDKNSVQLDDTV